MNILNSQASVQFYWIQRYYKTDYEYGNFGLVLKKHKLVIPENIKKIA